MRFTKPILGLMALLFASCSGGGQSGYDYSKIRKMADASLIHQGVVIGYDQLVLLPKDQTGETHRLIIYPEGVGNYKTAIFQLSPTEITGLDDGVRAFRHGAGNFLGQQFVGIWNKGNLEQVFPVVTETVLPISKPEITRDSVPELALMTITRDKPFEGLIYSDKAKEIYNRLSAFPDSDKHDPISKELADLEQIFLSTPLMRRDERRTDTGLGEQLLLMTWDDGYVESSFENIDLVASQILMATNFSEYPQMVKLPDTHKIRLHPGQTGGSDSQVRRTQIVLDGVIIPPKTSAVLVRAE